MEPQKLGPKHLRTVLMGCLSLDGKYLRLPTAPEGKNVRLANYRKDGLIRFEDTEPNLDYILRWVHWNGLLIADRCLLRDVSWLDLEAQGLTEGKVFDIDGKRYLCRLLTGGATCGAPCEWDDLLDAAGEDEQAWHCRNQFFWCQEESKSEQFPDSRVVRGFFGPRTWQAFAPGTRESYIGYRPVLEPIN